MSSRVSVSKTDPRPGILDHLSDGMSLVIALPFLALIPILLDALLWLVPTLSGKSLSRWAGAELQFSNSSVLDQFGTWLARHGDWDITRGLAVLLPSVIDGVSSDKLYAPFDVDSVSISTALAAFAITASILFGALLFVAFETWLATSAELLHLNRDQAISAILRSWGRIVLFGLIMAGVVVTVSAVMILPSLLTDTTVVGPDTTIGFLSLIGLILLIATMFVPEAIVLDSAGPIQAIRSSLHVVSGNFLQSIGFFLVSLMISPGLLSIWERITFHPAGLILAIVLNAAMVTSLALASLGFYQVRSRTAA